MRVSLQRAALALALPVLIAGPSLAEGYYYDEGQPPAAIALFGGANFMGEVREVFDPFSTLHDLAYNDRARSVAVLAGQWELCEHHNFTGRCVFVREDVSDLGWFGLEGRVSSVRPVFEYTEAQHGLMFTRDDHGYIRYAHEQSWGNSSWNYGYSSSVRLSVQHYGYSPDYWRYGYYDPRWGFDPYGFAWGNLGQPRYVSHHYRVHPRPVIVNTYWKKNWGHQHKHWNRRGHKDDWRRGVDRPPHGHSAHRPGVDRNGQWQRPDQGRPETRPDPRDRAWGPAERDRRHGGIMPKTESSGPPPSRPGILPTDPRQGHWQRERAGHHISHGTPPQTQRPHRDHSQREQINGQSRHDRDAQSPRRPRESGRDTSSGSPQVMPPRSLPPERTPGLRGDRPGRDHTGTPHRGRGEGLMGGPGSAPRPVVDRDRHGGNQGVRPAVERPRGGEAYRPRMEGPRHRPEAGRDHMARPQPAGVSRPAPAPRVERGPRGGGEGSSRGGRRPGSAQD